MSKIFHAVVTIAAFAAATPAIAQATADDVGSVCWNRQGRPVPCEGFMPPGNPAPRESVGAGSRVKASELCDALGDSNRRKPVCSTAAQEDPITDEPGTPRRTQGSGTR
jgi:hypothetical protein